MALSHIYQRQVSLNLATLARASKAVLTALMI
eukprot:COSAG02_NODE_3492_length_6657_cov_20.300091_3_plen_32_part_00